MTRCDFVEAELTPQLLETFQPEALLNVTFGGNAISTGDKLDQDGTSHFLLIIEKTRPDDAFFHSRLVFSHSCRLPRFQRHS